MHHPSNIKPLLCRELVGRDFELHELAETLRRAAEGQPQLAFLAGDAGLGKTRVCRAFMQVSHQQQARIFYGQAIRQDQALPFAPFRDAFRRYFAIPAGALILSDISLQKALAFVQRLLPELAPLFPGIPSSSFENAATPVQQQAMFHSVLYGVQALAQTGGGPLLLILEDLHWADDTSLELLAFLASRLEVNAALSIPTGEGPSRALMILCTYRPEALPDNPALGRLLLHLQAQRQVQELHLAPLALAEHQRYVKGILEQPVSEAFARFLFQWDEGNPFYTEELLGAMVVNGQVKAQPQGCLIPPGVMPHLPPSLTAAILERFNRLPAPDQEVLIYAAVIGRVFSLSLLTALCGMDERELVGVLRRAMSLQLISEVSVVPLLLSTANGGQEQERYQFRHALTREAIYNRMLACERRLRHRDVAQALEKLSTGDYKHLQPSRANSSSTHLEQQNKCRETHATRQPTPGLTKREEQVLAELAAGQTNREIAEALNISIGTVELHVTHILAKLGCETRTRAATYAIAKNLVTLDR